MPLIQDILAEDRFRNSQFACEQEFILSQESASDTYMVSRSSLQASSGPLDSLP
jgi:hypothetical protein